MELRDELIRQMQQQVAANEFYRDLIAGTGSLPMLRDQTRTAEFRRLLEWARVDIGEVIVSATAERLKVTGFRTDAKSLEGDDDLWTLWSRERMPLQSQLSIIDALSVGDAYVVCERRDDGTARLTAESSDSMVVRYKEGSRDDIEVAGKVWIEPRDYYTPVTYLTVYDATTIERWVLDGSWERISSEPNPLGFVPVTHLRNRPSLASRRGRSELSGLENDLARVTKICADLLLLSELSSFKVRTATGIDVALDDDGNPIEPFQIGPDRLLVSENENAKFGTLDESSLDPVLNVLKATISQVAALSRTPMFYLNGDLVNLSADALRAMDGQLVAKARQRQLEMAQAFEDIMRMALRVEGNPAADGPLEVMWADPESKGFGEVANGVTQLVSAGVLPLEQARVELGFGPVERERMRSYDRQDALTRQATERVAQLRAQMAGGQQQSGEAVPA